MRGIISTTFSDGVVTPKMASKAHIETLESNSAASDARTTGPVFTYVRCELKIRLEAAHNEKADKNFIGRCEELKQDCVKNQPETFVQNCTNIADTIEAKAKEKICQDKGSYRPAFLSIYLRKEFADYFHKQM